MDQLRRLTRLRWGVRGVLTLGVAASVAANILHAQHNPISQAIAAWPPIALLLTVELISRVPVHRRALAVARIIATITIATIAAWVSYHHMAAVAARYGETGASPYLLPLSVDGLVVVASVCLVELAGRITQHTSVEPTRNAHVTSAIPSAPPKPGDGEHDEATPRSPSPTPDADSAADAAPAYPSTPPRTDARTRPADTGGVPLRQRRTEPVRVHPDQAGKVAPAYESASDEDAAMYGLWCRGVAAGREPSGADLARAAGRPNDASGIGRKAARRYRDAHAQATTEAITEAAPVTFTNAHTNDPQTTAAPRNGAPRPWPHNGHRPNGAAA